MLSPTQAGSFSTTYDRVTLEAGQDIAKGRGPVQGSKNFVSELTTPHFPWTAFTIVVVLGVIAAVAVTRVLQIRAKREKGPPQVAERKHPKCRVSRGFSRLLARIEKSQLR